MFSRLHLIALGFFGVWVLLSLQSKYKSITVPRVDTQASLSDSASPQKKKSPSLEPGDEKVCVTIVVPATKPFGLMQDAQIISNSLSCAYIAISDESPTDEQINSKWLFLEHAPNHEPSFHPLWRSAASRGLWSMPNIDWLHEQHLFLSGLELVLCKTNICVELVTAFRSAHNLSFKVVYCRFTSIEPELGQADGIQNAGMFLHVAGQSATKNTQSIILAWVLDPGLPTLTVTSHNDNAAITQVIEFLRENNIHTLPPNINLITHKLDKSDLHRLMRSSEVHLCPSGVEGYGHYINEARAVGALVITTDHPPMNELVNASSGVLLTPSRTRSWRYTSIGYSFAEVEPQTIAWGVKSVLDMSKKKKRRRAESARGRYESDTRTFYDTMQALDCALRQSPKVPLLTTEARILHLELASASCHVTLL